MFGLAAVLCFLPPGKSYAAQFLWLSDIHFDPFADASLVDKLAAAEPTQWAGILAAGSAKFPAFGRDASWPLFASALDASKQAKPKAAFMIVTGDLLAHHFREQFDAAASVHDDDAFRTFVRKSVEFTTLELKQVSPNSPVIVSLGNNDDICGDYLLQPDGPFLHDTAKLVTGLAGNVEANSFSVNGSYSLPHPTLPHYRIIVLNTVFFSPRYRDSCGHGSGDPGEGVLTFLTSQLAAAHSHHEKVWLVCHIPPGVDAFATTHSRPPAVEGNVTLLWKDSYASKFTGIMEQYRGVVGPIFAGHLHTDDFRLFGLSKRSAFIVLAPAISPNIGQNPGFRVVNYDAHGRLTDQSTYFLSNLREAAKGAPAAWQLEYSFRNAWHMNELNAANYTRLYTEIASQAAARWKVLYPVSRVEQGSINPANWRQFYCAIGNISAAAYQTCVAAK